MISKSEDKLTLSQKEVAEIADRHVKGTDKWYRMFAGMSSDLERYENGVIYLKIENTEKREPSNITTAKKMVNSWASGNKELSQAKGFVVSFYRTESTGFVLDNKDLQDKAKIVAEVNKLKSSVKQKKHTLINIFSGLLEGEK